MSLLEEKKIQISDSTCTIFLSSDTFYGAHDLALVGGELAQQGGSGLGWARLAAPPILSHGPTIGWAWSRGRRWAWKTRLERAQASTLCALARSTSTVSPLPLKFLPNLEHFLPAPPRAIGLCTQDTLLVKRRLPSLCIFCFRKTPCIQCQKYVVGLFVI